MASHEKPTRDWDPLHHLLASSYKLKTYHSGCLTVFLRSSHFCGAIALHTKESFLYLFYRPSTSHIQCWSRSPSSLLQYWSPQLCYVYCGYLAHTFCHLYGGFLIHLVRLRRVCYPAIKATYQCPMCGVNIMNGQKNMVRSVELYHWSLLIRLWRQSVTPADIWTTHYRSQLSGGFDRSSWTALKDLFFSSRFGHVWHVGLKLSFDLWPALYLHYRMGFTGGTAMRTYGTEWRKHRRIFQEAFKPDSALAYRPAQANKARDMLYGILHKPDEFERIIYTQVQIYLCMLSVNLFASLDMRGPLFSLWCMELK